MSKYKAPRAFSRMDRRERRLGMRIGEEGGLSNAMEIHVAYCQFLQLSAGTTPVLVPLAKPRNRVVVRWLRFWLRWPMATPLQARLSSCSSAIKQRDIEARLAALETERDGRRYPRPESRRSCDDARVSGWKGAPSVSALKWEKPVRPLANPGRIASQPTLWAGQSKGFFGNGARMPVISECLLFADSVL
jgi:hypothetical protein